VARYGGLRRSERQRVRAAAIGALPARFGEEWQLNLGIEQPESEVDASIDPGASGRNEAPDGGFNVRWERSDTGHVQFATILRDIGVEGPIVGDQNVLGWGLNLSGGFDVFGNDSLQAEITYGEGIFRYINDDFQNTDAAFDSDSNLEALPVVAGLFGYTHHWNEALRSTVSYGYVDVNNTASQDGDAYDTTHYASINLVWQIRKRLSIGLEELYGSRRRTTATTATCSGPSSASSIRSSTRASAALDAAGVWGTLRPRNEEEIPS
jgi:hypothetical protein